jgi:four helix bundle protein
MQDFRNLDVWQKAHRLVLDVYQLMVDMPKEEAYGLTSQMRRAAVSVPTNIAEGCGRSTDSDFARFLAIALGSVNELEYLLLLAADLNLLDKNATERASSQAAEVGKMLNALGRTLRKKQ